MNRRWQKFVEINKLVELSEDPEDAVEVNLLLIDQKLARDGLKLPLGNGLEAVLFRFDNQQLTDASLVPTSIFTINGVKKLTRPLDRSRYYLLEQKTLQIRVLFSAEIMLGCMVVDLLNRPARVLAKALAFSYEGNFYTAAHRNGRILAKALLTNTNPKLVALLNA